MWRTAVLLLAVGLGWGLAPGTAVAHGDGGIGPEAHLPRIVAVDPAVPGLAVSVIEAGERLRIDNHTAQPVEVVAPPTGPRADLPVVAPGGTARWADARVRAAAADPVPAQRQRAWTVPLRVGGQPVTLRGEQVWPAPPSSLPWWLATVLTAAVGLVVGTRALRRPRWVPALATLTVLVAAAHVLHVVGSALVVEGRPVPLVVLGTAGPGVLAWVLAVVGALLTVARRGYGPLLCALSGAVLALVSAFSANNFSRAVLPFVWAPDLDRLTVVLTLGGGVGLFLAGYAALDRPTSDRPGADPPWGGLVRPEST